MLAEAVDIEVPHVLPCHEQRALLHVVQTEAKLTDARFARAGLPHQRYGLAGRDAEGEAVRVGGPAQDPLLGPVCWCWGDGAGWV